MLQGVSEKRILISLFLCALFFGSPVHGSPSVAATERNNSHCQAGGPPPTPDQGVVNLLGNSAKISWNPVISAREYFAHVAVVIDNNNISVTGSNWLNVPGDQTSIELALPPKAETMYITLMARNDCDVSPYRSWSQTIPHVPRAPTLVRLTTVDSAMRVSWVTNCTQNIIGCGAYTYTARLEPGGLECSVLNGNACLIQPVRRNQVYVAKVTARNDYGQSDAVESNAARLIPPPKPPANLRATVEKTSAKVQWRDSTGSGNVQYLVTVSPDGQECRTSRPSCTIKRLKPSTRYQFSVVAINDGGFSRPAVLTTSTKPVRPSAPVRPSRPSPAPVSPLPPPSPPLPEKPVVPIS